MTSKDRQVVNMRVNGIPIKDIASYFNDSKNNIDRILIKAECREYRKTRELMVNSRKNKGNGERMRNLITTVIESLERAIDDAVTDSEILALSGKVSELSRLVDIPLDNGNGIDLPVVLVPETVSLDEFNTDTENGKGESGKAQKPQGAVVTPGGSEIPHRPQYSKKGEAPPTREEPKYEDVKDL